MSQTAPQPASPLRGKISSQTIEAWLGATTAQRGRSLFRAQAVLDVQPNERAGKLLIESRVQGTQVKPYTQKIELTQATLESHCSCPVGGDCKHVAAALYALIHDFSIYAKPRRLPASALGSPPSAIAPPAAANASPPARPAGSPIHTLISQWLDSVEATTKPNAGKERTRELVYVLHKVHRHPHLQIFMRQLRKNGTGQLRAVSTDLWRLIGDQPNYLTDADRDALESLALIRASHPAALSMGYWSVAGERGAIALTQLLATGRLYAYGVPDQPLRQGDPRAVQLQWQTTADGTQQIAAEFSPPARLLEVEPPWYWDAATGQVGSAQLAVPVATFYRALAAPRVPVGTVDALPQEFADRLSALDLPLPQPVPTESIKGVRPIAVLTLTSEQLEIHEFSRWGRSFKEWVDYGRLTFDYAGVRLDEGDEPLTRKLEGGVLLSIERDAAAEAHARRTLLRDFGMLTPHDLREPFANDASMATVLLYPAREDWFGFLTQDVPQLRAAGFIVEIESAFRYRLSDVEALVGDIAPEGNGNDWFKVDLGILVDGTRHALMPLLLNLLQQNPKLLSAESMAALRAGVPLILQLGDGYVSLPSQRVAGILATLVEMVDQVRSGAPLRLNRVDAAKLADAELAAGVTWHAPPSLIKLARDLRQRAGIEIVPPPTGLNASLRPYQQEGLSWLQFLRRADLAGILADDMGLGKTVQALAHILVEKEAGRLTAPALIVAPTSLVHNWQREAAKFAPSLKVLALHGMTRKGRFTEIAAHDLVITTYPLLVRDREVLEAQPFHLAVLDEAQFIKNASTLAARVARDLNVRHRLCLTGTPIENLFGELWSQFNFLTPGLLGDSKAFAKNYRTPIEKHGDQERLNQLTRRLSALILRRTKEQVASELPAKTEIVRSVELLPAQRDLYESIRVSLVARVREEIARRGIAQSQIIILDALLKLRQVCCDPRLAKLESAQRVGESAKLDLLLTLLPELLDEGRRVLVFSQFTSMLALIEAELRQRGIQYVLLTGDTKDRATPVERFQNLEVPVFLISLKAGGTGLNLTAADCVIHYDPWWNPAAENQATDRAHRIGQDKPVFVYKLVALGTVEEKITLMQARKAALAASILGDSETRGGGLVEADIEALFEPLEPIAKLA